MAHETKMQTKPPVPEGVENTVVAELCENYPFMHIEDVRETARQCKELLIHRIEAV